MVTEQKRPSARDALRGAAAVIFDLGNTLVFPDWARIRDVVRPHAGELPEAEELQRRVVEIMVRSDADATFLQRLDGRAVPRHWHFRRVLEQLGVESGAVEASVRALDVAHEQRHLWSAVSPQALPVLEELQRRGVRLGVISNSEDGAVERILQSSGLSPRFRSRVDSFVFGRAKPHPEIFAHAVAELGVAAADAVYVGDMYTQDALGARGAGLRPVLLDPAGLHLDRDVPRIRSLAELLEPPA